MRSVLFGLLGLITGAALGLLVAFTVTWLWTIAGLPLPDEPKPSLGLLARLIWIGLPLGGVIGAIWFVRRERAGKKSVLILPIVLAAFVSVYVLALLTGF